MTDFNKGDNPTLFATEFAKEYKELGYNLDFTIDSLETEIDKILERNYKTNDEIRWKLESLLTAYIGECICKIFGGVWTGKFYGPKNPNGVNYYLCEITINNQRFYPSRFVEYYFSNGKESEGTFKNYLFKKKLNEWNVKL